MRSWLGRARICAERGGGVQFFLENNRLRFAVNLDVVQRAKLNLSSKLLSLARIVHEIIRRETEMPRSIRRPDGHVCLSKKMTRASANPAYPLSSSRAIKSGVNWRDL